MSAKWTRNSVKSCSHIKQLMQTSKRVCISHHMKKWSHGERGRYNLVYWVQLNPIFSSRSLNLHVEICEYFQQTLKHDPIISKVRWTQGKDLKVERIKFKFWIRLRKWMSRKSKSWFFKKKTNTMFYILFLQSWTDSSKSLFLNNKAWGFTNEQRIF